MKQLPASTRRWAAIKADPVLLERERARIRSLYARSTERRERQRQTGAAWRAAHSERCRALAEKHSTRRGRSHAQKRSEVAAALAASPQASFAQVARTCGVTASLVSRVRAEMEVST